MTAPTEEELRVFIDAPPELEIVVMKLFLERHPDWVPYFNEEDQAWGIEDPTLSLNGKPL